MVTDRTSPTTVRKSLLFGIWVGLLLVDACTPGRSIPPMGRPRATSTIGPAEVRIDPAHQACVAADDCILLYTDCSGCDCGTALNKAYETEYREIKQNLCSDYRGPVCEVYCPPSQPKCLSGKCVSITESFELAPAGETIAIRGKVTHLDNAIEHNETYFVLIANNSHYKVTFHYGETPPCENAAAFEAGRAVLLGTIVEVFGSITAKGDISTCDSLDYYIRELE